MTTPSAALGYVILYVEDVAAARATQAGATIVTEPTERPWRQTVAYVRDNHGFLVEICSPLPSAEPTACSHAGAQTHARPSDGGSVPPEPVEAPAIGLNVRCNGSDTKEPPAPKLPATT